MKVADVICAGEQDVTESQSFKKFSRRRKGDPSAFFNLKCIIRKQNQMLINSILISLKVLV